MSIGKTKSKTVQFKSNMGFWLPWRERPLTRSVVVHGLHKSATMFLFEFFKQVANDRNIPFFSENLPDSGTPPDDGTVFCFSPVRSFELDNTEQNENSDSTTAEGGSCKDDGSTSLPCQRIFHVRDPRDILVSEYFSLGWIHPEGQSLSKRRSEIQEMSVDEYVLQILETSSWPLDEKYNPLLQLDLTLPDYTLVRYEDMVLDFPSWVESAIAPFDFRNPQKMVTRYVKQFASQFEVKTESLTHRRKVTPGDHKEKLLPETIAVLNERFKDVLSRFGYEA